jgi:hypothetical protein
MLRHPITRKLCVGWLSLSTIAGITFLSMPVTHAQTDYDYSDQFETPFDQFLTPGKIAKVIAINEYALNVEMTPEERYEFGAIMSRNWYSDGGQIQKKVAELLPVYDQLAQLPEETQKLSRRATMIDYLRGLTQTAEAEDELSVLMLRAYRRVHPPLRPDTPFVSAEVADAFIAAYVFINQVKSGQQAPAMSASTLARTRLGIAADFARLPEATQTQFIGQMQRTTNLMMNWPNMQSWERLLTKAEVGASLSFEEQQAVQQIQQQLNGHSMQLAMNELRSIAQNQQIIMGSAPYWNPSSQVWEQKGGIVTEYH